MAGACQPSSVRIGIVAYWFNRGQGVVARQLRSALDELGHRTFVLARPTRKTNIRPDWIDREGVWAQAQVTAASDYLVPWPEYESWAADNSLELVLFDQNYQFDEIARLRESGVLTAGRFVWEQFSAEHVEPATRALDVVYSLTACERQRYAELGIDSPRVRWGCHPDLIPFALKEGTDRPDDGHTAPSHPGTPGREAEDTPGIGPRDAESGDPDPPVHRGTPGREAEDVPRIDLLFPGGFMSKRKPIAEVIAAFRAARGDELRLVVKAQVERQAKRVERLARGGRRLGRRDRRIELITTDMPTEQYLRLMASASAVIAPSRWEGLGLHLFEATALGVPIVTNDNPPMNEIVEHERNGLLVPGLPDGRARSGIEAFRPDVPALTGAIERLRDPQLRARLRAGARERRAELDWSTTVADVAGLLELVRAGRR